MAWAWAGSATPPTPNPSRTAWSARPRASSSLRASTRTAAGGPPAVGRQLQAVARRTKVHQEGVVISVQPSPHEGIQETSLGNPARLDREQGGWQQRPRPHGPSEEPEDGDGGAACAGYGAPSWSSGCERRAACQSRLASSRRRRELARFASPL